MNRSEEKALCQSIVPTNKNLSKLEYLVRLENHKLVTIIAIDAGEGQQRMLILVGVTGMKYRLYAQSQSYFSEHTY